ncbi:hypothetical protein RG836_08950, partial [Pseudomonas sp. SZMC_28357]|uniref:hypothetical protein n=1 Tax=Pseudomonas sp. SZMC_28357 TaxID=3074380 RepID=UPI002872055E
RSRSTADQDQKHGELTLDLMGVPMLWATPFTVGAGLPAMAVSQPTNNWRIYANKTCESGLAPGGVPTKAL